ncbi:PfkB family carbohydrate kinase [Saccharopolyspora spinosa]|uniref:PfkB family carbohydrate kinase n=1 Tax=Saccharopolyspora spinosa TaxID=60894 RepID=A0A2N3XPY2_SACSN|nr:PfkB family carbohydrate kinase [Saccharopolyspora spinosa]PKW12725.1 pfkB family carbohydrate kinase [Saccharopolyspora spinosa]
MDTGDGLGRRATVADVRGQYRDFLAQDGVHLRVVLETGGNFADLLADRLCADPAPSRRVVTITEEGSAMSRTHDVVVVGSLNIDLTARVHRRPLPGETVQPAAFRRPERTASSFVSAAANARLSHEGREILRCNGFQAPTENVVHAAELRRVGARSVVVTFGADGAAVADAADAEEIPGVPVDAVDTTGAGDAFAATVAWLRSLVDLRPSAVHWATRVGACSVQHCGAQASYPVLDRVLSGPGLPD